MPQIDTSLLLTVNAASILRAPTPQVQKRSGVRYHSLPPLQASQLRQSIEPTRQTLQQHQPRPLPVPKSVPILRTENTSTHPTSLPQTKSTPDGFKIPDITKARKSLPHTSQTTEYASSPALVLKRKLSDLYARKIPTISSKVPTIESTEKITPIPKTAATATQPQHRRSDPVTSKNVTTVPRTIHSQGIDTIVPPKRSRGRPRKDGTPAQPRIKPSGDDTFKDVSNKPTNVAPSMTIIPTKVSPPQRAQTKAFSPQHAQSKVSSPENRPASSTIISPKANTNAPSDKSVPISLSVSTPKEPAPVKRPRGRPRKHPLPPDTKIVKQPNEQTPSPIRKEAIKKDHKVDNLDDNDDGDDEFHPPSEPTRSGRSIKPPSEWWSSTRRSSGESLPRLTWGEMPPDTPRRREGSLAREGSFAGQMTDNNDLSTRQTIRHVAETPLAQSRKSKLGMSMFMPSPPPEPAIDPVLLADTTLTDLKQEKSSQSIEALPDSQGEDVIIDSAEEDWSKATISSKRDGPIKPGHKASDDEDYSPRPQKPKKPKSSKVNKDPNAPKRPRGRPRKYPIPDTSSKDKGQRSDIHSGLSTAIIQHFTAIPSLPSNNIMSWHFSDED